MRIGKSTHGLNHANRGLITVAMRGRRQRGAAAAGAGPVLGLGRSPAPAAAGGGWFGGGPSKNRREREYRDREYRDARARRSTIRALPPPTQKKPEATTNVVVMGDAMADWLALRARRGLRREAGDRHCAQAPDRIRPDPLRQLAATANGPQVAEEIIAAEKPKFIVMMVGNNDRQPIRERAPAVARPACPEARTAAGAAGSSSPRRGAAARCPSNSRRPQQRCRAGRTPAPEQARPQPRPLGVPHREVGGRLYQARRCDHGRTQGCRRARGVGRSAVATRLRRPAAIPRISTRSIAAGPRRPGSPTSTSGTGSSTRVAGFPRRGPTTKDRPGGCEAATGCISPSSVPASSRTTSSASCNAISPVVAFRSRCRCRRRPDRAPSRAEPRSDRRPGRWCRSTASGKLLRRIARRSHCGARACHRCDRDPCAHQGRADCCAEWTGGRFQLAARKSTCARAGGDPALDGTVSRNAARHRGRRCCGGSSGNRRRNGGGQARNETQTARPSQLLQPALSLLLPGMVSLTRCAVQSAALLHRGSSPTGWNWADVRVGLLFG